MPKTKTVARKPSDLLEKITAPLDTESWDPPRKYYVNYPDGVTDNYGHTHYPLATRAGALKVAKAAFACKSGERFALLKDF